MHMSDRNENNLFNVDLEKKDQNEESDFPAHIASRNKFSLITSSLYIFFLIQLCAQLNLEW